MAQIHELIGKAMGMIGAIGKDSKNAQQGFMYRGIDAVYNALNPVMSQLGLFIAPEVLDMKREERTNKNGTVLIYTALTIKYTVYAPDGSNISLTVVGEGMDTGDKSVNKAMSIAMKYAMFQLFFIATEDLKDPDAEVYTDIQPKQKPFTPPAVNTQAVVDKVEKVPPAPRSVPHTNESPVMQFLLGASKGLREARGISAKENNELFKTQRDVLVKAKLAPGKPLEQYTMEEAEALIDAMQRCFLPLGTELKTE